MARLYATVSVVACLMLAGMPASSFAQSGGGTAGSATTGAAGAGNATGATRQSPSPPPGTNSLGTAQSSGVTTGTGHGAAGADKSTDAVVQEENRVIDKRLKGICRGC
ncbi:hypothetical protein JQ596_15395 [Bradyrhizobium manausense]|uniref:hypothetical protein n=1 Tax=Bradyrhizobium TaxID=374 RepID=UPI001BA5C1FB|nr:MULTISPECIES: hypothetical protein [Bradyrhizobium]MBR0826932.1 hypothetical protein [Bradyrhizobium manausense]UVO32213.1 hypothetical protein KUF59_17055 [Bradyrhizobium arachidis]